MPVIPRQDDTGANAPPTDAPPAGDVEDYTHHGGFSQAQIGAIAGTVVGFTFFFLLFMACLVKRHRVRHRDQRRRRRHHPHHGHHDRHSASSSRGTSRRSSSRSEASLPSKPPSVHQAYKAIPVIETLPGGTTYRTYKNVPVSKPRRFSNIKYTY